MNTRVQVEHCVTEMIDRHRHRQARASAPPPASRCRSRRTTSSCAATRSSAASTPRTRRRTSPRRPGKIGDYSEPAGPRRARRLGRRPGRRGHADVRPDGRQADRLGRRPRAGDAAHAARARRVRDRGPQDADPVPQGAARHRAVGQRARPAATSSRTRSGSRRSRSRSAEQPADDEEPRRSSRLHGRGLRPALRRQGHRPAARRRRRRRGGAPRPPARRAASAASASAAAAAAAATTLASPLQGNVLEGRSSSRAQTVEEGQLICIIEAMKMENEITAHKAGVDRGAADQGGRARSPPATRSR